MSAITKMSIARPTYDSSARILVEYADGFRTYWGETKTERGAKAMLTRYAKRHGLVKIGEVAVAA